MAETTAFELVTPARVLMARDAEMVVAPGEEGLFGVLPRHTPLVSSLKRGVVEIYENNQVAVRIMIDGGVADVNGEQCIILAERAERLDANLQADLKTRYQKAQESGAVAEAEFLEAAIAAL